jgi:hypothetical protein
MRTTFFLESLRETRPFCRTRSRWKYIGINFSEIGFEVLELIHLAQDRDGWHALLKMVEDLQVTLTEGNFLFVCSLVNDTFFSKRRIKGWEVKMNGKGCERKRT